MARPLSLIAVLLLCACGAPRPPDAGEAPDAGTTASDAGSPDAGERELDAGSPDAGDSYVPPTIGHQRSLFWTQPELVDEPSTVSFAKTLAAIAHDGHGGRLLDAWFRRFNSTAHSERAMPAQLMDEVAAAQGADPSVWNLSALPFKVTGVHNRIDLADLRPAGHCGELRISFSCEHPTVQPLHVLFLFQQPLSAGDTVDGRVTCEATARRWAELSRLEGAGLIAAVKAEFDERLTAENFLIAETVELTVSPWEWRQWFKVPDATGQLPWVLDNAPLFQTVDTDSVNAPGPLRDDFLNFVTANAAALDARTLLIPERFRRHSARVTQGVPRTPLSLAGISPTVTETFPQLRQNVELMGCPACHTADADFVQTRTDRKVSPFYEAELLAREVHLDKLARGDGPTVKFGPLQTNPKLPQ